MEASGSVIRLSDCTGWPGGSSVLPGRTIPPISFRSGRAIRFLAHQSDRAGAATGGSAGQRAARVGERVETAGGMVVHQPLPVRRGRLANLLKVVPLAIGRSMSNRACAHSKSAVTHPAWSEGGSFQVYEHFAALDATQELTHRHRRIRVVRSLRDGPHAVLREKHIDLCFGTRAWMKGIPDTGRFKQGTRLVAFDTVDASKRYEGA